MMNLRLSAGNIAPQNGAVNASFKQGIPGAKGKLGAVGSYFRRHGFVVGRPERRLAVRQPFVEFRNLRTENFERRGKPSVPYKLVKGQLVRKSGCKGRASRFRNATRI